MKKYVCDTLTLILITKISHVKNLVEHCFSWSDKAHPSETLQCVEVIDAGISNKSIDIRLKQSFVARSWKSLLAKWSEARNKFKNLAKVKQT